MNVNWGVIPPVFVGRPVASALESQKVSTWFNLENVSVKPEFPSLPQPFYTLAQSKRKNEGSKHNTTPFAATAVSSVYPSWGLTFNYVSRVLMAI